MDVLYRPLGNRIARPISAAMAWGLAASAVATVIAFAVGAGSLGVRFVLGLFGDTEGSWSWELVADVGAVLALLTVISSTWAAAFGSTHRAPTGRAAVGAAIGVAVLALLVRLEAPGAAVAAGAAAWSVAIPFERWDRALARVIAPIAIVVALQATMPDPDGWQVAGLIVLSYPMAAVAVGIGDEVWRSTLGRSSLSERDRRERNKPDE